MSTTMKKKPIKTLKTPAIWALVMLSLGWSSAGCGGQDEPTQEDPKPTLEVKELRSTLKRAAPVASAGRAQEAASYGFKLYAHAAQAAPGQNVAVSPLSLGMALGMVGAGAEDQTAQEIVEALGYESAAQMNEGLNAVEQLVLSSRSDRFVYEPANQLWIREGFRVNPAYLDDLAVYYDAGVNALAMDASAQVLAQTINDWVTKRTRSLIKEVVTPSMFEATRPLAIWANAFYLNAKWASPFPSYASGEGEFTTLEGAKVSAWMMTREDEQAEFTQGVGFKALRLPFDQGQASMLVILPDEGAFAKVEGELDAAKLAQIEAQLAPTDLKIKLPRFKFDAQLRLKEALASMGVQRAFSGEAQFGKLTDETFSLTQGLQKITLSVDEEGTVGAVVSIIWGSGSAMPQERQEFIADRPFLFAVIHHETKQIMIMGRVLRPEFDRPAVERDR